MINLFEKDRRLERVHPIPSVSFLMQSFILKHDFPFGESPYVSYFSQSVADPSLLIQQILQKQNLLAITQEGKYKATGAAVTLARQRSMKMYLGMAPPPPG